MPWGMGHYYKHYYAGSQGGGNNTSQCTSDIFWFPGSGAWWPRDINWVYNEIHTWYWAWLGRHAEMGGANYWYDGFTSSSNGFVNGGSAGSSQYNTSIAIFIANAVGPEQSAIATYGAHWWQGSGSCPPPPVYGCMDPNANNYNSSATVNQGCTYNYGCTDPSAYNYDSSAYINDGTCTYQGCMDPNANNYNSNATVPGTCTYNQPTVSFSRNPGTITSGQSSTLSWSTSNAISGTINHINYSISPVGSGSKLVYPSSTKTYTLTVSGYGGTSASATTTVTVYTVPNVTIWLTNTTIPQGGSTTLNWSTTGDASSASINQGIGSVPLSSNTTVNPTSTTTYTINVSGSGGSDSANVTLTVAPPPTCSITASPNPLTFGSNITLTYSSTNATSVTIYRYYTIDNTQTQMTNLTVSANQSGTITDTIDWVTYDGSPSLNSVQYTISASNGFTSASAQTAVIPTAQDKMPDLITIPVSDNLDPDEEPVISPVVTSNALLVDDIDVPVEVQAAEPIKVEIDGDGNWQDVREI